MPEDRVSFQDIKSWTPAIDPRAVAEGTTFVLSGRNYLFDSRGPYSAFASRLLHAGNPIEADVTDYAVWSLQGFVFTPTRVGQFSADNRLFVNKLTFDNPIVGGLMRTPWTRAVFGEVIYFCHRATGILKYDSSDQSWAAFDPGIQTPIAVCESNGRLIVLGVDVVAWSGPGDPEDFTPELGGAGAQNLFERIGGRAVTVIPLAYGYLVHTTQGGFIGEFIDGDNVFRHYVSESRHVLLAASAITQLTDGSYIICTRQGLHLQEFSGQIQPLTPVFNEYLRDLILRSSNMNIRLEYIESEDRLYVQTRDWTNAYNRTFVLSLALDKWGEFSKEHFGIIRHGLRISPGGTSIGYVDRKARPHYFLSTGYDCEVSLGVFEGLDSEVILGPLRSPALQPKIESIQETHTIVIGQRSQPAWSQYEVEDLGAEPNEVEDEQTLPEEIEDQDSPHLALPITNFQLELIGDLSGFDWKHPEDLDSESELVQTAVPSLVRDSGHAKYYSCALPGVWHRLRLVAKEQNEYFHITFGEITVSYTGEL